jgi:[ribosomal protein S18]-alanine N-acetyltransferase
MSIDSSKRNDQVARTEGNSFRLRPFRFDDLLPLFELDQICFRPGIAYSYEDLQEFLFHPSSITVIAEDEQQQIAGFAILEFYRERKRVIGHVITLDVHPAWRRLGLGRKLMSALQEIAKKSGASLLRLEVASDDEGAQAFYFRLGFTVAGRLRKYYMDQIDALSLERLINSDKTI